MAIVKRAYDTRVREIIARTGNADLFPALDIPRGTLATWVVRHGPRRSGLSEELVEQARQLDRIAKLEHRVRMLTVLMRLVLTMLRLSGFRVHMPRIPEGKDKQASLGPSSVGSTGTRGYASNPSVGSAVRGPAPSRFMSANVLRMASMTRPCPQNVLAARRADRPRRCLLDRSSRGDRAAD